MWSEYISDGLKRPLNDSRWRYGAIFKEFKFNYLKLYIIYTIRYMKSKNFIGRTIHVRCQ